MPQERAGDRGATARRLLAELRPYSGKLVLAFGLVVLGAGARAGGPWLIGRAIDRYILPVDAAGLSRIMLVLFGVYIVGAVASRGQVYQVGSIGQSLLASMRARIFDRLQHLPLGFFDRRPVGDLMSRVTNDVDHPQPALLAGAHPATQVPLRRPWPRCWRAGRPSSSPTA